MFCKHYKIQVEAGHPCPWKKSKCGEWCSQGKSGPAGSAYKRVPRSAFGKKLLAALEERGA